MVDHYGTRRSLIEAIDEKHQNWFSELVSLWISGLSFPESTYAHRLGQLFLLAAHHGDVVIIGRGARFFLPCEQGLSVRALAPLEYRVHQIMLQMGMSDKTSLEFVTTSDRNREAFVREHFRIDAADPHHYELVVNVEKLSRDDAVDMIVDAAKSWLKTSNG